MPMKQLEVATRSEQYNRVQIAGIGTPAAGYFDGQV